MSPSSTRGFRKRSCLEVAIYWKVGKGEEGKVEDFSCHSVSIANTCFHFTCLFRRAAGDYGGAKPPSTKPTLCHHWLHIIQAVDLTFQYPSRPLLPNCLSFSLCFFPLFTWTIMMVSLAGLPAFNLSTSNPLSTLLLGGNVILHLCLLHSWNSLSLPTERGWANSKKW